MFYRACAFVSCVLLLGACSGESSGGDAGSPQQKTVLESLTPERFCALLPDETIEKTLDATVDEATGRQSGRPPILNKTCRYALEFTLQEVETLPPSVSTEIKQTQDDTVDEALDYAFTDLSVENAKAVPYERVNGLGEGAGYGDNPFLGNDLEESQLVVVFTPGDERFVFDVAVSPQVPLEELEPLATELLSALESELG